MAGSRATPQQREVLRAYIDRVKSAGGSLDLSAEDLAACDEVAVPRDPPWSVGFLKVKADYDALIAALEALLVDWSEPSAEGGEPALIPDP